MAFDAGSFMEKFKASLQPIFDEFKVRMLEILAEKQRRTPMASAANTAGTATTLSAQPEVDAAAAATYHQEAAMEEKQEAETMKPNTMVARLFTDRKSVV